MSISRRDQVSTTVDGLEVVLTDVQSLACVLLANPDDHTVRLVLIDALQEQGRSVTDAVVEVDRIQRAGWDARDLVRAERALHGTEHWHHCLREWVRIEARVLSDRVPIDLVGGDQVPTRTGRTGRYVFPDGTEWSNDGVVHRWRGRPRYVPSTVRVTVGARRVCAWLDRHGRR